jgi:hypothetical protein
VRWVVSLFLGASLNFVAIRLFQQWLQSLFLTYYLFWIGLGVATIPAILVFLTPIVLSLGLTRVHPEKRLVPPLYIQLITLGMFLATADYAASPYLSLLMIGLYVGLGGLTQDKIVLAITGRTVDRDSIVRRAFMIVGDPERIAQVLTKFPYVGLDEMWDTKPNGAIVLRSPKDREYTTVVEITRGKQPNHSFLSVAFYQRTRYYLRKTADLEEYARIRLAYIRDVFSRDEYRTEVYEAPDSIATPLLDSIIDEMQGLVTTHFERLSGLGWVKMVSFIGAVAIVGILLFYMKDYGSAITTVALILLYLAFELPSRLSRD